MRYFGGGIGHLGTSLAPSVDASEAFIPDDSDAQEEDEDLEFILGADFEKELAEDDEYDQQSMIERDYSESDREGSDEDEGPDDDDGLDDDDDGYDDY